MFKLPHLGLGALLCMAPLPAVAQISAYIGAGVGVAFWDAENVLDLDSENVSRDVFASALVGVRYGVSPSALGTGLFVGAEAGIQVFDTGYDLNRYYEIGNVELDFSKDPSYKFLALAGVATPLVDVFGQAGYVSTPATDLQDDRYRDFIWGMGIQSSLAGGLDIRFDATAREISEPQRLSPTGVQVEDRVWEVSLSLVYNLIDF